LAWDAGFGVLYGSEVSGTTARIVRIDPATGAATAIKTLADMHGEALVSIPGLPDATVGVPYESTLPISGGCPDYSVLSTGTTPPGLTLDSSGKIGGTPTQSGEFVLDYQFGDSDIGTPARTGSFPIVVRPANDRCSVVAC